MKVAQKQAGNASNRPAAEATQSSWQNQSAQSVSNSKEAVAQRALIAGINDSPRMLAQRRRLESYLCINQPPISEAVPPASPIAQQQLIQRLENQDDEEALQPKFISEPPRQLERQPSPKPNNTSLPDNLKSGIESLSDMSLDNVKVHYNSSQPAQLNALAYAEGTDIHVAPGQEQHLPHEAWHVVQQAQGRVKPTMQAKGVAINDDHRLENEADIMGEKANTMGHSTFQMKATEPTSTKNTKIVQRMVVRIRDLAEMMHLSNSTIMNASLDTVNGMSGSAGHKEVIGISQAVQGRKLDQTEELRIVAHGSMPSLSGIIRSGLPSLGGFSPDDLATKVADLFPSKYDGTIYLNGCYTATRLGFSPGTSYIELFAMSLAAKRPHIKFTVSGNLGTAATLETGTELITLDKSVADLAIKKGWPVEKIFFKDTIEYKVTSPLGMGYADNTGGYNDMGLTETFEKEKQQIREEQLRREAPQEVERLRKQNLSNGIFSVDASKSEGNEYIINDML